MGTLSPCQGGLPMAGRWLTPPWGCRAGGNPAPDPRDLQLCSGTGSCCRVLPPALTAPPTKHGLGGGKWNRDPTRAPLKGRNLVLGRMRTYRKVFPSYTFTNTLSPSRAADPCPAQPKVFHWQSTPPGET